MVGPSPGTLENTTKPNDKDQFGLRVAAAVGVTADALELYSPYAAGVDGISLILYKGIVKELQQS